MCSRTAVVVVAVAAVGAIAWVAFLIAGSGDAPASSAPQTTWIATGSLDDPDRRHLFRTQDIVQVTVEQGRVSLQLSRGQRRAIYRVSASEADICRVLNCTVLAESVEPLPSEAVDVYDDEWLEQIGLGEPSPAGP